MKHYSEFHNIHKDKPGLLICNGPSLSDVPVSIFTKYPKLGSNSVYANKWLAERPVDYYFIEGANHLRTPEERAARMPYIDAVGGHYRDGISLVNRRFIQFFQHLPNVYAIDYKDERFKSLKGWSYEPFIIHATGACVTFAMLQFAYYFGINPLLIVGMDHRFEGDDWHFFKDEEAQPFKSMSKAEYDGWKPRAEYAYSIAQRVFEENGRKILNLTPDTACNMFYKDKMENWI